MAETPLKKFLTSLVIREMEIKTTLRFYLTPVKIAEIKISYHSRCRQGCGERGTLLYCWWDCKLLRPLWKSIWQFLRKMDIVLPEGPTIPFLSIYPKESPTYNNKRCTSMFIAALYIIARCWVESRCPSTGK